MNVPPSVIVGGTSPNVLPLGNINPPTVIYSDVDPSLGIPPPDYENANVRTCCKSPPKRHIYNRITREWEWVTEIEYYKRIVRRRQIILAILVVAMMITIPCIMAVIRSPHIPKS